MTGGITLWKDRGYDVEVPKSLTKEQRERYSRHLLIPEVGIEGQQKLLEAKVLLLGAGGLGSPAALYLAAAGVGTIGIVDNDVVDLSNLQRQVAHTTDRIGTPKVDSAEQTMKAINPDVEVVKYPVRLDASNIMEIIEGYDVIVDGLDNFPTRYLLNDASVRLKIPVVSAAILGFDGQLSVFAPTRARATAASSASRRPPSWRPPAAPTASSASCPGRWACCRPPRPSSSSSAPASRSSAACSSTTRWARPSRPSRSTATRSARSARATPTRSATTRWASSRTTRRSAPRPASRQPARIQMATVKIPPVLRNSVGGEKEVSAEGSNVGEVLRALVAEHPSTESQIFSGEGELNRYVNVYLNDEDVRVLDGLDTPVGETDSLVILPAMAGGAR